MYLQGFPVSYGRCAGNWPFEIVESLSQQGQRQRVEQCVVMGGGEILITYLK